MGEERANAFKRHTGKYGLAAETFCLPFEAEIEPALLEKAGGVLAGDTRLLLSAAGVLARSPTRAKLVGFDVPVWAPLYREPMTVIQQPVAEIAHLALALLPARISEPDQEPVRVVAAGRKVAIGP